MFALIRNTEDIYGWVPHVIQHPSNRYLSILREQTGDNNIYGWVLYHIWIKSVLLTNKQGITTLSLGRQNGITNENWCYFVHKFSTFPTQMITI